MKKMVYYIGVLVCCSVSQVVAEQSELAVQQFGTGWVVAPHFVVTNNHVVNGNDTALLIKTDKSTVKATVVIRDAVNDIALLKVANTAQLPPGIPLSRSTPLMGEQVFTIGYPHPDVMGTNPKLSVGIINSLTGMANDPRTLQISTPVQAGNSGGPLLNMKGEAIGIVTSKLNAVKMFSWTGDVPQNVNYAVKMNYLKALIDSVGHDKNNAVSVLPRDQNTLVNLSQQIQDSIVLIQTNIDMATPNKKSDWPLSQNDNHENEQKRSNSAKQLALFTFMERGDYDKDFDLDDTDVYSNNTARLVEKHINKYENERLNIAYSQYNSSAKWRFYDVHKESGGQRLCAQHKVDYLLGVKNDFEILNYFEEIEFVMKDCDADHYVSRTYYIEPNVQDKFIYESDIRKSLVKFLAEYLSSY